MSLKLCISANFKNLYYKNINLNYYVGKYSVCNLNNISSRNETCLISPIIQTKNFSSLSTNIASGILPVQINSLKLSNENAFTLNASCLPPTLQFIRLLTVHHIDKPSPYKIKKNLRFKVQYPEDGEYAIKKLPMTKLGGRDPETGRLIFGKIGGGSKRLYRWVVTNRVPPGSQDPLVERVIHIQRDPNRTAFIALVGHEDKLRFITASMNMKQGDLISSTRELPRIPVRPKEGDAHPIGALPFGTVVCCIETEPGGGAAFKVAAGTSAVVSRALGGKIVIHLDALREFALDPNCLATVGRVSNPDHDKEHIGSAQRARWLGIRPSSGLWQRKTGRHGYKPKKKGPPKVIVPKQNQLRVIHLSLVSEESSRRIIPCTNRVT